MRSRSQAPGATRALAILRLLAAQPGPVPAAVIARDLALPRSTTYHLLTAMAEQGFVTHIPEERSWGLDVAAFEIGSAYLRHRPLERLARPLLRRLVDQIDETAHLGILHGADIVYLLKEQPRRPSPLISEIGLRLPAHLTATGQAILAYLPAAQIRALFPSDAAFTNRTGRGPRSLTQLRQLLTEDRKRGWSVEDEYITCGYASVAVAAFDHGGRPSAAIGVTFSCGDRPSDDWPKLAHHTQSAATALTGRLRGHAPPDHSPPTGFHP